MPRQLQGRWFDISPEGNLWVYVFRANSYDMFEVKPQTNQLVVIDGEPVQLKSGRLNFRNGVLHLSSGTKFEDGPFDTRTSADASQLGMRHLDGSGDRMLTRARQI